MSNLVPFRTDESNARRSARKSFLVEPEPHSHAVQFYESEAFLFETVQQFLAAGLQRGDGLIVIATAPHLRAFTQGLESHGIEAAAADGRLTLIDARAMLAQFMVADMPDPERFCDALDGLIARVAADHPSARIRAYGEMVDVLWQAGNSRAAIRLEELWNEAGQRHSFSLLCAYVMGSFYKEADSTRFIDVCRTHSHVIPTEGFVDVDDPRASLREITLLQQRAGALESEVAHRKVLEDALRDALRERTRVEAELRRSIKRETEARERAEASDSFKEMFLGILGHDLRNPLNTVLTTARLLRLRGQVPDEADRRLERIVSSGVRMERMIEQLLDVARARLTDGIPVDRSTPHDLATLVGKIVDEVRAANPTRPIAVEADHPCVAHADADRLEQVISNLLGNAITYGDPARPITIALTARGAVAILSVHNFGAPIAAAARPTLFDPFKRVAQAQGGHQGLGLGLYIVERIVTAHGGKIHVQSSADGGTRFEVALPLSVQA